MFFKAKNIFIVFAVLLGLVFSYDKVLAAPVSPEEIDQEFQKFQEKMKDCEKIQCKPGDEACVTRFFQCITNLQTQISEWSQGKLGEIKQKAEELQKDITSLKNQIGYLDAEVQKTEIEIRITQQEIDMLNLDITQIEEQIKNTEEEIQNTENKIEEIRQRLADTVKKIYEYDTQNLVKITLTSGTLSDFFNEISYVESLQKGLADNLAKLKENKSNLEAKKATLEDQKASLAEKRREVSEKIDSFNKTIAELDASKREKAILLEITKGDQEKYQKLMAEIEEQKKQLLGDLSTLSKGRELNIERLCGVFKVPYFAQDTGGWEKVNIGGFPGVPMYKYGCAVTSVAMVFKYYGIDITPGQLAQEKIFTCNNDGCGIIMWPSNWSSNGVTLKRIAYTHGNLNWDTIKTELNQNHPVIINIAISGRGQHYVVIVGYINGEYWVYDPIYSVSKGCAVRLKDSVQNIEDIYKSSATHDQMIIYHP